MDELVEAVRAAVARHADWPETVRLVAHELKRHLPSLDILTAEEQNGDPTGYRSHLLLAEPDGSFSIVALVWRPGQVTPIHDHVTWCVFGVIQGVEHEELYRLDGRNDCLVEAGSSSSRRGDVSGFTPEGRHYSCRPSRGGSIVLVDESAEPIVAVDLTQGRCCA